MGETWGEICRKLDGRGQNEEGRKVKKTKVREKLDWRGKARSKRTKQQEIKRGKEIEKQKKKQWETIIP